MLSNLLFYCFTILSLISASMVILSTNAVYSVLFLILVFCNIASILFLIGAEFLALLFLIVYVGAIAVLFLFVVMMLNIKMKKVNIQDSLIPLCFIIGILLLFQLLLIFNIDLINLNEFIINKIKNNKEIINITWFNKFSSITNIETIGLILYTSYSYLFILCSLILLIAMIGAIILTLHQRIDVKKQYLEIQLSRNAVGIVKFNKIKIS